MHRSTTPLMTNLLPAAVGADGRVNLFVGNVSLLITHGTSSLLKYASYLTASDGKI